MRGRRCGGKQSKVRDGKVEEEEDVKEEEDVEEEEDEEEEYYY